MNARDISKVVTSKLVEGIILLRLMHGALYAFRFHACNFEISFLTGREREKERERERERRERRERERDFCNGEREGRGR